MSELDASKGLQYSTNRNKCHEFATAIADVQHGKISEKLAKSKFVSVLVDGSMDSSVIDNEIVYIQTCQGGITSTHFIYCSHVCHRTAMGIINAIKKRQLELLWSGQSFKENLLHWVQMVHQLCLDETMV